LHIIDGSNTGNPFAILAGFVPKSCFDRTNNTWQGKINTAAYSIKSLHLLQTQTYLYFEHMRNRNR
jgi:hypothetical protein